ncbi:MAG: hypothetical protein V3580_03645 [Candidatus Cardinium sp.]
MTKTDTYHFNGRLLPLRPFKAFMGANKKLAHSKGQLKLYFISQTTE